MCDHGWSLPAHVMQQPLHHLQPALHGTDAEYHHDKGSDRDQRNEQEPPYRGKVSEPSSEPALSSVNHAAAETIVKTAFIEPSALSARIVSIVSLM